MDDDIRMIIAAHGLLSSEASALSRDDDLYEAGMTSHASVAVMLALEDRFDVEFPESMLQPEVFQSIATISAALAELEGVQARR